MTAEDNVVIGDTSPQDGKTHDHVPGTRRLQIEFQVAEHVVF
jgi:hypothetical protein